ncbi:MltA domain-containing protein [Lyticum sinuosum]|uniref:peptidoglycan lytic exotransglycosylase n=1 Tax=Lyticum sinuosum TaxID=1332059 RepID=A0AAE4VM05_9RICK|nr:MltA domain-containing protein [Lyticum sinuosum]MDZ5761158.1 Membrane-bound lytic murein transglycosylase A precursor [Lyticum sinuosum]
MLFTGQKIFNIKTIYYLFFNLINNFFYKKFVDYCIYQKILLNLFLIILHTLIISGCSRIHHNNINDDFSLKRVTFNDLNRWNKSNTHYQSLQVFTLSCKPIKARDPSLNFSKKIKKFGKNYQWQKLCDVAEDYINKIEKIKKYNKLNQNQRYKLNKIAKEFWEKNFTPYFITHKNKKRGIITGYFSIELKGSRSMKSPFIYPIYKVPDNNKIKISRKDIENGAIKGSEIIYVDDIARKYFLHVQGSGKIVLNEDNSNTIILSYHKRNGFPYRCINEKIIKYYPKTKIGNTSEIIKWLNEHKNIAQEIINHDPSYIFFKEQKYNGFIGAQGIPLTTEQSAAVDNTIYSYGTPIWVDTIMNHKHSVHKVNSKYSRLLIAQDRGGAINGSNRIDLFFGSGKNAERRASSMREYADFYILLPH